MGPVWAVPVFKLPGTAQLIRPLPVSLGTIGLDRIKR
jgi:hypothetical protein